MINTKKKKGTLIVFLVLMTLLLHSCAISNPCDTDHGGHAFARLEIVEEDKLDFRNEKCFHFYLTTV